MKVLSKVLLLAAAFVMALLLLVACGAKVSEITVKKADMPQLTYVQGQELDLSAGKLTVKTKDSSETIALDSDGVTVTGYDPETLGKQTLTVTYQGKTTEITVTVVARMAAEGIEKGYFVGDSFDKSKGYLKITKDDTTTETVSLSSDDVKVEGFDSSKAGDVTLTATYKDYTGTFTVKIYEMESDTLHKPNKLDYMSHDGSIDLTGGYITFKSPDGELTRYRELTEDMVSGFDLSAATEANRTTPLKQEVTISYAGKAYATFEISITYSDVTTLNKMMTGMTVPDWSGTAAPQISTEQGELALEILNLYESLSTEYKALVDETSIQNAVRMAAVYGYQQWETELNSFSGSFTVSSDGTFQLVASSYATVKADCERLQKSDEKLNVLGKMLGNMATDPNYQNVTLWGSNTVGSYLATVVSPKEFESVIAEMSFLVQLADGTSAVPADWTMEGLQNYSTDLDGVLALIAASEYKTRNAYAVYQKVSTWREADDLIEILYSYAYVAKNTTAINTLKYIYLPGEVEELYELILAAMQEMQYFSAGSRVDSSWFMLYYRMANNLASELSESENELYSYLYQNLTFNNLLTSGGSAIEASFARLLNYLTTGSAGFYQLLGTIGANNRAYAVFDQYLTIAEKLMDDANYLAGEEGRDAATELLNGFIALSAADQYELLMTLNPLYNNGYPQTSSGAQRQLFDFSDGKYVSYFAKVIDDAAKICLNDATYPLSAKALLAMESYAAYQWRGTTGSPEAFLKTMEEISDTYTGLSASDRARFDQFFDDFFSKYQAIAAWYQEEEPTATDLGDWKATFDELQQYLGYANTAYSNITSSSNAVPMYSAFFSAAEHVFVLANKILTKAPDAVVFAYLNERMAVSASSASLTMDTLVSRVRMLYMYTLENSRIGSYLLLNYYVSANGLPSAMDAAAYVIWGYVTGGYDGKFNDAELVKQALKSFRELSLFSQQVFRMVDGNLNMYFGGLSLFYKKNMTAEAAAVAEKLTAFETAYYNYQVDPTGMTSEGKMNKAALAEAMEALQTAYEALSDADRASFDQYLSESYQFYLDAYAKLTAAEQE